MHGVQVARRLRVLAERVPQQGHQTVQHPRGDVAVAPDGVEDLVAGEDPAGRAGEQGQHGERLRFQWLPGALAQQPPAGEVDRAVVEGERGWR